MNLSDLEFNILNGVVKSNKVALDFTSNSNHDIFISDDAKFLVKVFSSYIKNFKGKPTRRVMLERYSDDHSYNLINSFFDKTDKKEYDENEYGHDLSTLKNNFINLKYEGLKNILSKDYSEGIKLIKKELSKIESVKSTKSFDSKPISDYIDDFRQDYIDKAKNPELGKGLLTGYSYIDYIKNGLRPADLLIIAGETGSGKSQFMNNMAIQMWLGENTIESTEFKKGCNVVYFSLEMPYKDCFRRSMSRIADVESYAIRDAKLSKSEAASVSKACKFIKKYPYIFEIVDVPRGLTVEQMESMYEEIKQRYNPDVIFVDYLGLMEDASDDEDDWLSLGKLAGKVHEFARTYSIPVVTAVQLNRMDPEKKNSQAKSIGLHRIGRSSLIATHASLIVQIEKRVDENIHNDFIYHIIKNRDGEDGGKHSILKNFAKSSIIDVPYIPDSIAPVLQDDLSGNADSVMEMMA
jgi:replicative DNA helicase